MAEAGQVPAGGQGPVSGSAPGLRSSAGTHANPMSRSPEHRQPAGGWSPMHVALDGRAGPLWGRGWARLH